MTVYLGLGSNQGNRRENLSRGVTRLQQSGLDIHRVSPPVESPAWLPVGVSADWNRPFLNLVIEAETSASAQHWYDLTKSIQTEINGTTPPRYQPRSLDIDLLLWNGQTLDSDCLKLPHPEIAQRNFVLSPLVHLAPGLRLPDQPDRTVLQRSAELDHHIPLWMAIINLTPDSFSDGGQLSDRIALEARIDTVVSAGAQILDLGAESTRPDAATVSDTEEWLRLRPALDIIAERYGSDPLRPWVSIDTRHPAVAARALEHGADIINDVSGLTDPGMIALARDSDRDWVAMHHLTVPADKNVTLPPDQDPVPQVEQWLLQQIDLWSKAGLDLNRIIFDPGIGFGKDGLQSLHLLREAGRFRQHGLRTLIGHSRKSFMRNFADAHSKDRDLETVGASMQLCHQSIDIIRVHNIPTHLAAYRAWSHLLPQRETVS